MQKNANKLAPGGSSQPNESFNSIVASKHPKKEFYGASESMPFRVAAAVCQENYGTSYILKVYEKLCLSPGKNTEPFRHVKDAERAKNAIKRRSIAFKQQRLFSKKKRSAQNVSAKKQEGITYKSEYAMSAGTQFFFDQLVQSHQKNVADNDDDDDSTLILFDLETSDLSRNTAEICQIAARHDENEFNVYMVPKSIAPEATNVTGLHVENNDLFLHNVLLPTLPPRVAFDKFMSFLRSVQNRVILVAHNGLKFDAPIILRYLQKYGFLEEFERITRGFSDTLPIFRNELKDRANQKKSFSLTSLANDYLGGTAADGAHNALTDINILKKLIETLKIPEEHFRKSSLSVRKFIWQQQLTAHRTNLKASLKGLAPEISKGMFSKMAQVGISLDLLKKTYTDGGQDAIRILLTEDVSGKPRVTKNASIIAKVVKKMENNE
ncbi:uncharacterized protein [Venturia canescens]|uniref:uncharacterized protein n=1 Tax=Venturia canescens TaxID=32260 RepID=UPI001C9CC080|nr:uncharacterized protein LOC122413202 [Venturia canescens]